MVGVSKRRICWKKSTISRTHFFVGGLLISLMRNADRIKSRVLAQLVNVIAPL
jgi:alpha-L-arabinofuranosidase